jgi:small subunit ribosomal protein S17
MTDEKPDTDRKVARAAKSRARRASRLKARTKARERKAGAPAAEAPVASVTAAGRPKLRQGVVVSDKPDKTITVRIDITRQHRMYQKILRSSQTLHVHDESNEAHAGDTVRVIESRPTSRTKRWRLVEVLERAR